VLAEALFKQAQRLMTAGKIAEACPKLEESYRLVPKLGTLLNLATCHDKQGKTGSAWDEYTRAITQAKQSNENDRVEYARKQLDELEKRLSRLQIDVPKPIDGLEVALDGRPLASAAWSTPIPLDPGSHEIVATAPGQEPWKKSVELPQGSTTVSVEVPPFAAPAPPKTAEVPAPPPPPVPKPVEADDGSSLSTAGWVVGAVGIIGLGVGTGFGINSFIKNGDSDDYCDGTLCAQEGIDLRDAATLSANVSNVAFGVGIAATVAGIVMLAVAGSGEGDEAAPGAGATTARWWFGPTPDANGVGAVLGGAW
jgi:hypothetical protein